MIRCSLLFFPVETLSSSNELPKDKLSRDVPTMSHFELKRFDITSDERKHKG